MIFLLLCNGLCFQSLYAQNTKLAIQEITFEGNTAYPNIILQNYIYSKEANFIQKTFNRRKDEHFLNRNEVKNDVLRLRQFYRQRGYPNAQVTVQISTSTKKARAKIQFEITEGIAQKISSFDLNIVATSADSLVIVKDEAFQKALDRHAYRAGKKFESVLETDVKATLLNPLKRIGYPFASITLNKSVSSNKREVQIEAILNSGTQRRIGEYIISGIDRLSDNYVLKEAELEKNVVYDQRKIENAQEELFNHPLVRFVTMSVQPNEEDDDLANIQINLRERKLRTIQLTGGIGLEETIRGQVNWIHRDFLATGHQFNTETAASFIEQRASASYQIPWLFNTHSSLVVSPFIQNMIEPGFNLLRGGLTNTVIYRATDYFTGSFAYNLTRNREQLTQQNIALPDSIQNYDVASINTGILFSSGYVKDKRGWVVRANNELSGLLVDATYPFQKFSVDIRHYNPAPWQGGQLAFKIEGGRIFSDIAQDSLPRNVRFFLGGTSSIRGWNRQQLGPKEIRFEDERFQAFVPKGGRSMLAFSFEIRQNLPFIFDGFGIAAFLDGGNIWADQIQTNSEPIRFGSGLGLRYNSPIGPLRVDFGYKINPSDADRGFFEGVQYTDGKRWAIHFSLGQAF